MFPLRNDVLLACELVVTCDLWTEFAEVPNQRLRVVTNCADMLAKKSETRKKVPLVSAAQKSFNPLTLIEEPTLVRSRCLCDC